MNPKSDKPLGDWESRLDCALKNLPDRQAPATLVPRVLQAIQARARLPWWRRTWWNWPPAAQIFSLLICSAILGGVVLLCEQSSLSPVIEATSAWVSDLFAPLAPLWHCLGSLSGALVLVAHKLGTLVFLIGALLCLGMYLSCVGLGTLCYRLVIGK